MKVEESHKKPPSFTRWLVLGIVLSSFLVCGLIWTVWRTLLNEFPDVSILKSHYAHVEYRGPKKAFKVTLKPHPPSQWVRLDQVSPIAIQAIITSEDGTFFSHQGYDPHELKEAIKEDLTEGKFSRGASTITMQVVKNVFLTHKKSIYRKVKEIILSIRLDREVSKRRILETYLNLAEWGEGTFGIYPASQLYFGKHPAELNAKEGAFLAMLLPSPKKYSQSFRSKKLTQYAGKTITSILKKMNAARHLSDDEYQNALLQKLPFEQDSGQPVPVESDMPETELEEDNENDTVENTVKNTNRGES